MDDCIVTGFSRLSWDGDVLNTDIGYALDGWKKETEVVILDHFETDMSELREYLDAKRAGKDLRPVVHAHWEWDKDGMDWNIGAWKCSACKRKPETWWNTQEFYPSRCAGSHFCGNCGAIMDEEVP